MLIPDKCMKCKLNSDERLRKCKDCPHTNICEPLINKTRIAITVKNKPLVFLKDDVKSAVEFYKKYRSGTGKIDKKIHALWMKYNGILSYNNWLFNYCFKDVIK